MENDYTCNALFIAFITVKQIYKSDICPPASLKRINLFSLYRLHYQ